MSGKAPVEASASVSCAQPLEIAATGMVTPVGMDCLSSCAAIRAAIDNFSETRFVDDGGEWVVGSSVPMEVPWRGARRLSKMLALALDECVQESEVDLAATPLLVCLAEKERPGRRTSLGNLVFFETQQELGQRFHHASSIIEHGRVGGIVALQRAHSLIYQSHFSAVLIAGVDSLLVEPTIRKFQEDERLLTSVQFDGFIPGEAACAMLVKAGTGAAGDTLYCTGVGFGGERATIYSCEPLRADGLTDALRNALTSADANMDMMDFRIVDVSGEQYWFKETALAMSRLLRVHKEEFPLWHIADCVGETGAAVSLLSIAYLKQAFVKRFAPGLKAYLHASNDDHRRAAAVFEFKGSG